MDRNLPCRSAANNTRMVVYLLDTRGCGTLYQLFTPSSALPFNEKHILYKILFGFRLCEIWVSTTLRRTHNTTFHLCKVLLNPVTTTVSPILSRSGPAKVLTCLTGRILGTDPAEQDKDVQLFAGILRVIPGKVDYYGPTDHEDSGIVIRGMFE